MTQATLIQNVFAFECSHLVKNDRSTLSQVWQQTCLSFYISGNSDLLRSSEAANVVVESFDEWSQKVHDCTSLSFEYGGYVDAEIGFDNVNPSNNHNLIASVDTAAKLAELKSLGIWPGDEQLVALTIARYSSATAELIDVDIMLNNAENLIQILQEGAVCDHSVSPQDLKNTLVHEIGHFIGFEHVTDAEATMFDNAKTCETLKRDLAPDDLTGLCTVYPAAGPISTCTPPAAGYAAGNTGSFRGQCERVRQTPVEGCDCNIEAGSNRSLAGNFYLLMGSLLLLALRSKSGRDGNQGGGRLGVQRPTSYCQK